MTSVELEWGLAGGWHRGGHVDAVVVVDVLSFGTAVAIALEQQSTVWPHPGGASAGEFALAHDAVLAGPRLAGGAPSLSPASLLQLEPGSRLVLPSPNGGRISHALGQMRCRVFVAGLRNALAVADALLAAPVPEQRTGSGTGPGSGSRSGPGQRSGGRIGSVLLLPAGERWPDGSMRVAYEDLVGAGAVAKALIDVDPRVELSPEAEAAVSAYQRRRPLADTPSGRELIEAGFEQDVRLAEQVGVCTVVPELVDGAFG